MNSKSKVSLASFSAILILVFADSVFSYEGGSCEAQLNQLNQFKKNADGKKAAASNSLGKCYEAMSTLKKVMSTRMVLPPKVKGSPVMVQ
jgi:hypothetical protein